MELEQSKISVSFPEHCTLNRALEGMSSPYRPVSTGRAPMRGGREGGRGREEGGREGGREGRGERKGRERDEGGEG